MSNRFGCYAEQEMKAPSFLGAMCSLIQQVGYFIEIKIRRNCKKSSQRDKGGVQIARSSFGWARPHAGTAITLLDIKKQGRTVHLLGLFKAEVDITDHLLDEDISRHGMTTYLHNGDILGEDCNV